MSAFHATSVACAVWLASCCGLPASAASTPTPSIPRCVGDCDGDSKVSIDEILLAVNIALGAAAPAVCSAGVRIGGWGWASCFADFDNDGWLDLFQVNGYGRSDDAAHEFVDDPAVLFMSNHDGTFTEQAAARGIADRSSGCGVVCADFDRDGDIDVFIANSEQPPRLYRNDGSHGSFLTIRLRGTPPNTEAISARVYVTAGGQTQMRELRAGSNYASQDPAEAHFGLGSAAIVDQLRIVWPDGRETERTRVAANQLLTVTQP